MNYWTKEWEKFKTNLPHQHKPFSKRNWGHPLHSICSYSGKLKPSIAHQLVKIFVPENGKMLDPFSGVGTIPFEAGLQSKKSFAFDLSPSAFAISKAKLTFTSAKNTSKVISDLENFIGENIPTEEELKEVKEFGFNKKIKEYYHEKTLGEIILARRFFLGIPEMDSSESFVFACLLHILHGNRPYALSRRSHPITPYAPTGEFEYRALIPRLKNKIERSLQQDINGFCEGNVYDIDSSCCWPYEVDNLDAVITSPPFFDSTRFYMFNWLRVWFSGWSKEDFKIKPASFIDERQKESFEIYEAIIRQSRERLKEGGVLVFHLGKSKKCDMAEEILKIGKQWFKNHDMFVEDVSHIERHGIKDKGTTTGHSYLVFF